MDELKKATNLTRKTIVKILQGLQYKTFYNFHGSLSENILQVKKHFEALGHADIKYDVITTYEDLRDKVIQ